MVTELMTFLKSLVPYRIKGNYYLGEYSKCFAQYLIVVKNNSLLSDTSIHQERKL